MTLPPLPDRWRFDNAELLSDGIGGTVWRVTRPDGAQAALKRISTAARDEARSAAQFLRWRDGDGSVRLLDAGEDLVLLEWAGTIRLLDHFREHGAQSATLIAGEVLRRLHGGSALAVPAVLRPLERHFSSLFARANAPGGGLYDAHFVATASLARRLLDEQRDVKPLHGDLHHENILHGSRGWVSIDPKGLIGDPAYDAANMFQNPVHSPLREDPAHIASTAEMLAEAVGRDVEAVLGYAFAYSGLSTAWWLEDGNTEAAHSTMTIGRVIGEVLAQVRS